MNYEEKLMQEEAHYWFCLNEVADYVELFGTHKVIRDVVVLLEQRKAIDQRVNKFIQLEDVPF